MFNKTKKLALLAGLTLSVSACADGSFYQTVGASVDEGGFGNPTMTNTLISTGELAATEQLARRFASEVIPMVNFEFNSDKLDADAKAILREQASWIRQFPEVRFRVYGHTDLVGSNTYNKRLGQRRANAVVRFLTTQGIERSRLEAVVSFGETQPLIVTEFRDRRNRRTVTEVTGFVDRKDGELDGEYAEVIYRTYLSGGGRAFDEVGIGVAQGN